MYDFLLAAFDVALSFEPSTMAICIFAGFCAVWRLVWYLVGGLTNG